MSESIAEMVLPGTYVEVRAEGLIGVGAISTGNIGIVGTAAAGPVDEVVSLGSYSDALDLFGAYDPLSSPTETNSPLTLTRTLEQVFAGGGSSIFAVRAANGTPTTASLAVQASGAQPAFTLTARGAGTWGRAIHVVVVASTVDATTTFRMTLTYRNIREVYEGETVNAIHDQLADSRLVTVGDAQNGGAGFELIDTALGGGSDGATVTTIDLARSLAVLEDQPVNIVLVGGGAANVVGNILLTHVERTENDGKERIALVGAQSSGTSSAAADVLSNAGALSDDRVVLCAPGMVATDAASGSPVVLPPAYTAAVVAGKLATLAPHVSLTNKQIPITPDVRYGTTLTKTLLQNRVLVVRRKIGAQVVKGITTAPKPFDQISIRRIVDYAKAGVRSDPTRTSVASTTSECALRSRRPWTASSRRWCSTRCSPNTSST